MDFTIFLEFPGILIPVGVLLLIIALIIGIVSMRKSKREEKKFDEEVEESVVNNTQPITPVEPVNYEPVKPVVNEPSVTPIMPVENEQVNVDVAKEATVVEEPKETISWPTNNQVYGGVNPTEGIKLDFEEKKESVPYGDASYKVEEVPSIMEKPLNESIEPVKEEKPNEDVEML